jgi:RNA polymerase sigma-70 factor (ECF subfamily)
MSSLALPLGSLAAVSDPARVGRAFVSAGTSVHHTMTDDGEHEFAAFFEKHYARLAGVLTAATGDRELAADCAQEAFVKAHLHWRKVREYTDPFGWLRRVAINLVRDHARRAERGRRARQRLAGHAAASTPAEQPVDLILALDALPLQQRIAMALHYVEGLSVAEVADAMQRSEGAVKYHLHEGRERLRRVVDERVRREV